MTGDKIFYGRNRRFLSFRGQMGVTLCHLGAGMAQKRSDQVKALSLNNQPTGKSMPQGVKHDSVSTVVQTVVKSKLFSRAVKNVAHPVVGSSFGSLKNNLAGVELYLSQHYHDNARQINRPVSFFFDIGSPGQTAYKIYMLAPQPNYFPRCACQCKGSS